MSERPVVGKAPGPAATVLALGPALVVFLWLAAGQWTLAGREPRAWLVFIGTLWLASLVPMQRRTPSRAELLVRVERWGWIALVGLLVVT